MILAHRCLRLTNLKIGHYTENFKGLRSKMRT